MPILTIEDANAALHAGDVTAEAFVLQSLTAINEHRPLNAIAEVSSEQAHKTARERDRQQAAGVRRGPLHGIPITAKDLFQVEGFSTRGGTRAKLPPLGTSTAVARLQNAGAIVIGKANMHEIALGLTGKTNGPVPVGIIPVLGVRIAHFPSHPSADRGITQMFDPLLQPTVLNPRRHPVVKAGGACRIGLHVGCDPSACRAGRLDTRDRSFVLGPIVGARLFEMIDAHPA